jgi:multiple sugar transport system substrate-binding protein
MSKKISACLLIGAMALSMFAGCGGGSDNSSAASSTPDASAPASSTASSAASTVEPVATEKIRVWSDNAHEKALRDEQVQRFNDTIGKEKGIELEYTVYGTGWADTIKIAAQADDAAELYRPNTTPLEFVESGYLLPITDFPGGDDLVAKYEGSLITNDHIYNGKVYTLPYNLTTYKYVVNVDLFEKAGITEYPKTWAEMRDAAKKITEVGAGVEYGFGLSLKSAWTLTSGMTRQNFVNTGHIGFDNTELKFKFADFLPALQTISDIISDGSVLPGFEGMDADQVRAQFAEGKIGILNAASFDVAVFTDQFPAKCEWDVIDPPSFDDSGNKAYKEVVGGTNLLAFGTAAAKMPEKCMEVFQYFYSDENLAEMYEHGLYIPFRQEALDLATKEPEAKNFAKFASVPNNALVLPMPSATVLTLEGDPYDVMFVNLLSSKSTNLQAELEAIDQRYNDCVEKTDAAVMENYRAPEGWTNK